MIAARLPLSALCFKDSLLRASCLTTVVVRHCVHSNQAVRFKARLAMPKAGYTLHASLDDLSNHSVCTHYMRAPVVGNNVVPSSDIMRLAVRLRDIIPDCGEKLHSVYALLTMSNPCDIASSSHRPACTEPKSRIVSSQIMPAPISACVINQRTTVIDP